MWWCDDDIGAAYQEIKMVDEDSWRYGEFKLSELEGYYAHIRSYIRGIAHFEQFCTISRFLHDSRPDQSRLDDRDQTQHSASSNHKSTC